MTVVKFFDEKYIPAGKLTYSVICARFSEKWILVRHNKRNTWEICGGHIEDDESPEEAARRELMEETGAVYFTIECIATYSVEKEGYRGYGRLYLAEVSRLGIIADTSEIAEIKLFESLPDNLTYADVQPHLFRKTIEYLKDKGRS